MKKMKIKRRKFKYRILIYILFIFIGYQVSYNIIMNVKLAKTNDEFIKCLLADSNYHMLYEKKASNLFSKLFNKLFDINSPVTILENSFHYKTSKSKITGYVNNPTIEVSSSPKVYIYNTHQTEYYSGDALKNYNITPGVMMASYILQDKLSKEGVETIVLEDDITDYMNLNNMKHSQSYIASRYFIEDDIKQDSLKLIVDLHRDSISKEKSTTIINNKSCAKIAFVIGSEYDSYESNLNFTNQLNDLIKEKYPDLTRGILIKGGSGNNGIYNQDLSPIMTLLELGAQDNTIDEVLNTIELLSPIIKEFVDGE